MFRNAVVLVALILGTAPLLSKAGHALVSEPVEGAFGMQLGAEFIASEARHGSTAINGQKAYFFSPTEQSHFFDFYLVQITPATHLIHTIIAVRQTSNSETCQEQRAVLMPVLTERYGPSKKYGPVHASDFAMDYEVIVQADGKRAVSVMCGGASPVILQMMYLDDELTDLAEQERLQLEEAPKEVI